MTRITFPDRSGRSLLGSKVASGFLEKKLLMLGVGYELVASMFKLGLLFETPVANRVGFQLVSVACIDSTVVVPLLAGCATRY